MVTQKKRDGRVGEDFCPEVYECVLILEIKTIFSFGTMFALEIRHREKTLGNHRLVSLTHSSSHSLTGIS